MGFFGIGTGEILLILILVLIIWGPGRLPEIARKLGKAVRTLRKASYDLTTAMTREIDLREDDLSQPENPPDNAKKPSTNNQSKPPEGQQP